MKYFLYTILGTFLFFQLFLLFKPSLTYATTAEEITSSLGCGYLNNQCCKEQQTPKIDLPKLPIPVLGWVIDKLLTPVEGIINSIIVPVVQPVTKLILHTFIGVDSGSDNFKCTEGKPLQSVNSCT